MKSQIRIFILAILLLLSFQFLSAENKHFGIFAGGNYFAKSQRPGFKVYDNNYGTYGYYILDEVGFSAHVGVIGYINDKISIEAKYRFPRFTSSVYASTYTPYVWGPNTYFTQSMSTSWTLELRYHLEKIKIFEPYLGLGFDLARIEAYNSIGFIHPETYIISYILPPDYLGIKHVPGLVIPFGVNIDVYKDLKINANMNYTIMNLKQWDEEFPRAADQNFGGFYFNVNVVYNIW